MTILAIQARCPVCGLTLFFKPREGSDYGVGLPQHPWIGCRQDGKTMLIGKDEEPAS